MNNMAMKIRLTGIRNRLYWRYRFGRIGMTVGLIAGWFRIVRNARKIAIQLDDCMRELGQLNHNDRTCTECHTRLSSPDTMTMKLAVRKRLSAEGYQLLPKTKWR